MKKLLWLLYISGLTGCCQIQHPYTPPSGQRLSNTAALLAVHGPTKWLPATKIEHIHVTLSSGITQENDFFLWVSPYRFPDQAYSTLYLQLYPGKVWAPSLALHDTLALHLQSVACHDPDAPLTLSVQPNVLLATVFQGPVKCLLPFLLPGASVQVQRLVTKVLQECQDPLIVPSATLKWRQFSSLTLLLMQPAIMIVDGSRQTLEGAASMVDAFLAAHAVLSIAWEPSTAEVRAHLICVVT
jgi:hypothetical protein